MNGNEISRGKSDVFPASGKRKVLLRKVKCVSRRGVRNA